MVLNPRGDKSDTVEKSHIIMTMKKRLLSHILLFFLVFTTPGCVFVAVGSAVLGGYVISPDTVEGLTSHSEKAVWHSMIEILSIMGRVTEQYEEKGMAVAQISGATVTVTVYSMTEKTVKLRVKARKSFLPKIAIAQDVFVKIMGHVK